MLTSLARRLGRAPGIERLVSIGLLARAVEEPVRFFLREALRSLRGGTRHGYRLRGTGVRIFVEHDSPDRFTLDEIFYYGVYEPPAAARPALEALRPGARVADLGANVGLFLAWLLARVPRLRVVAYEPDPRNAELLRRTLVANEDRLAEWELRLGAAGAAARELRFAAGAFAASRADPAGRLTVACWDVLELLDGCDVAKIDIEGGEWEILRDARLKGCRAPLLIVEPHAAGACTPDHVAEARDLLRAAGYETEVTHAAPIGATTIWAWRA